MDRHIFILSLLFASLVAVCVAQQPPCPNIRECSCSQHIIECHDRHLTSIPDWARDFYYTELHLQNNNISEIHDDAFRNLNNISIIQIDHNQVHTVGLKAFRGLERTLNEIDISYNNLDVFPPALGDLLFIQKIDASFNPLNYDSFDDTTMYNIGDTLRDFTFGSRDLEQWPQALRHLQDLSFLNVTGGSFLTLPPDAFHGFEGTLKTLSMQNTAMIAIPFAFSKLRFLDHLYFDHNHAIGDSGILITSLSNRALNHLEVVSLTDDNLTVFPSLLQFLPNVNTLILDSNRLAFVSEASVEVAKGTGITNLSMKNCSLARVPGALSKLTNLTSLNLANNQIRSFENSDFENMRNLQNLTITGNPLEFIGNGTFRDLTNLRVLDILESNIHTMPEAIRFLTNLTTLKLPINKIECTCNIAWLKQFMEVCNRQLKIEGSCETIESTIEDFLKIHIPHCPNYSNATQSCH